MAQVLCRVLGAAGTKTAALPLCTARLRQEGLLAGAAPPAVAGAAQPAAALNGAGAGPGVGALEPLAAALAEAADAAARGAALAERCEEALPQACRRGALCIACAAVRWHKQSSIWEMAAKLLECACGLFDQ